MNNKLQNLEKSILLSDTMLLLNTRLSFYPAGQGVVQTLHMVW
jgi:hypothetical protein